MDGSANNDESLVGIWAGNGVFAESAFALQEAFGLLGLPNVPVVCGEEPGDWASRCVWVLIGVTHMSSDAPLPPRYVVYQMEQLTSPWLTERYLEVVAGALAVWEFAPRHVTFWRLRGLRCDLVPLSASPVRTRRRRDCEEDVDVLFYGSGNARRLELRRALDAALRGYRVVFFLNFDLFGEKRDRAVDGAKVVLNLHFYEDAALEVHRINYLLSRGKCVLSERSADAHLDAFYGHAVAFADTTASLAALALALLRDDKTRRELERRALNLSARLPAHCAGYLHTAMLGAIL
mmetsp:Transcript_23717/g.72991  ORF Transcript_23717/g.72991 Transcript_23717/m.72991 type:complete len:292 (+) Transcript_23717:30-905(+)